MCTIIVKQCEGRIRLMNRPEGDALHRDQPLCASIYEQTAHTYDRHRKADPEIADELMQQLRPQKEGHYLDVGCGSGNYTKALAERGLHIEGTDLSDSMLAKAEAKAPELQWTTADMRSLPFEINAFAGVLTVHTLHYIKDELVETFSEIRRVLQPGGRFVVLAVGLEQALQFWVNHYFPFFGEVAYRAVVPRETIVAAFQEAGFSDVSLKPYFTTEETADLFSYACKYRPHLFLDPTLRAGMTPFQLPEYAEEVERGCEHLEQDLKSGAIYRVIAKHESDLGEGLFVSGTAQ